VHSVIDAERDYAECRYAGCRHVECQRTQKQKDTSTPGPMQ
jgi:hypothetical protein